MRHNSSTLFCGIRHVRKCFVFRHQFCTHFWQCGQLFLKQYPLACALQDDLLLLKTGGRSVYYGDVGRENCSHLVSYFESRGAQPISSGDNPANWMLRVVDNFGGGGDGAMDLARAYVESEEFWALTKELSDIERLRSPDMKIEVKYQFARSWWKRQDEVNRRLRTIYWRSPAYNYARMVVSLVIATVLGLPFVTNRNSRVYTESDMRSRVSVIFLSFIIVGIMAMLSVLPVMRKICDMFYRQRYAGMYSSISMGIALGVAEKWFIIVSTVLFSTVFLATAGFIPEDEPLDVRVVRCISFWVRIMNVVFCINHV